MLYYGICDSIYLLFMFISSLSTPLDSSGMSLSGYAVGPALALSVAVCSILSACIIDMLYALLCSVEANLHMH